MSPFFEWLAGVDPMTRDVIIVLMGFAVVFVVRWHQKKIADLEYKYHTLRS